MLERLSIVIASPDLESRTRLREVLNVAVHRASISQLNSVKGVIERLLTSSADVVLLGSSFGRSNLETLLTQLREKLPAMPPIGVFMTQKNRDFSNEVAALYLAGVGGFIAEPYTTDEIVNLITTMRSDGAQAPEASAGREKKAVEFLLHGAVKDLDELASRKRRGEESGGFALVALKALSAQISGFATSQPEQFLDVAERVFSQAKPAVNALGGARSKGGAKEAPHPATLVRELMQARGLDEERVLGLTRHDKDEFKSFLNQLGPLNEPIAQELSRIFGRSAKEWVRMQSDYDRYIEQREDAKSRSDGKIT